MLKADSVVNIYFETYRFEDKSEFTLRVLHEIGILVIHT